MESSMNGIDVEQHLRTARTWKRIGYSKEFLVLPMVYIVNIAKSGNRRD